jgi:hypothetical protein
VQNISRILGAAEQENPQSVTMPVELNTPETLIFLKFSIFHFSLFWKFVPVLHYYIKLWFI